MSKRLGKFYISKAAVEEKETPDILARMGFVPWRVEFLAHRNNFEYIGTSKLFDEHKIGYTVPEYQIIISTAKGKKNEIKIVDVKAELVKE